MFRALFHQMLPDAEFRLNYENTALPVTGRTSQDRRQYPQVSGLIPSDY